MKPKPISEPVIHGPDVPNYALLNEAAKAMTAPTQKPGRKLAGKIKPTTAQSQRRDQATPK